MLYILSQHLDVYITPQQHCSEVTAYNRIVPHIGLCLAKYAYALKTFCEFCVVLNVSIFESMVDSSTLIINPRWCIRKCITKWMQLVIVKVSSAQSAYLQIKSISYHWRKNNLYSSILKKMLTEPKKPIMPKTKLFIFH